MIHDSISNARPLPSDVIARRHTHESYIPRSGLSRGNRRARVVLGHRDGEVSGRTSEHQNISDVLSLDNRPDWHTATPRHAARASLDVRERVASRERRVTGNQ